MGNLTEKVVCQFWSLHEQDNNIDQLEVTVTQSRNWDLYKRVTDFMISFFCCVPFILCWSTFRGSSQLCSCHLSAHWWQMQTLSPSRMAHAEMPPMLWHLKTGIVLMVQSQYHHKESHSVLCSPLLSRRSLVCLCDTSHLWRGLLIQNNRVAGNDEVSVNSKNISMHHMYHPCSQYFPWGKCGTELTPRIICEKSWTQHLEQKSNLMTANFVASVLKRQQGTPEEVGFRHLEGVEVDETGWKFLKVLTLPASLQCCTAPGYVSVSECKSRMTQSNSVRATRVTQSERTE